MSDPRIEYLGSYDSSRLLSREGEVELARQIEQAQFQLLDAFVACRIPLETFVEESEFSRLVQKGRELRTRVGALSPDDPDAQQLLARARGLSTELQQVGAKLLTCPAFTRLSIGEQTALRGRIAAANHQIERAQALFVQSNLRLVVSIARRFKPANVPFIDLIQEGNLGLLRAVSKFDYRRGYRLSTYATWWIRQTIARAVADKGRAIRVPVHMLETRHVVERTRHAMVQETGEEPTPEEIAVKAEVPLKKVYKALDICLEPISLDAPVRAGEDFLVGDHISDDRAVSPIELVAGRQVSQRIGRLLKSLSPREEMIMRMRFGIGGNSQHTLEKVGQRFGVTRERVRQIESKALRRMRKLLEDDGPGSSLEN